MNVHTAAEEYLPCLLMEQMILANGSGPVWDPNGIAMTRITGFQDAYVTVSSQQWTESVQEEKLRLIMV